MLELVLALESALTVGLQLEMVPKPSPALDLGLQLVLELLLEKLDTTFQVQARQVVMYKGHRLLLSGEVWRLTGILQVPVQRPGAQDGGDGTEGGTAGSGVGTPAFFLPHGLLWRVCRGMGSYPRPGAPRDQPHPIPSLAGLAEAGRSVMGCSR